MKTIAAADALADLGRAQVTSRDHFVDNLEILRRFSLVSRSNVNPESSRRVFLASAIGAASAALLGFKPRLADATGSNLPHLTESDPLAKSLGYKANAKNVDRSKFPTYKPGERCGKCRFFEGTPGQQSGYAGCQIYAGYSVNADGWCSSFNART
ncbi:MAG: high-potential iron-sulfur protein [Steroidobacteraceae bacterium]